MNVEVSELRRVADKLFDHLESNAISSVSIDRDHYWTIPSEARYDVHQEPKQLDIGQLSADLESLREMSRSGEPAVGYGLVWLAAILRAVGEQQVA